MIALRVFRKDGVLTAPLAPPAIWMTDGAGDDGPGWGYPIALAAFTSPAP